MGEADFGSTLHERAEAGAGPARLSWRSSPYVEYRIDDFFQPNPRVAIVEAFNTANGVDCVQGKFCVEKAYPRKRGWRIVHTHNFLTNPERHIATPRSSRRNARSDSDCADTDSSSAGRAGIGGAMLSTPNVSWPKNFRT